jgi:hypothetical protein
MPRRAPAIQGKKFGRLTTIHNIVGRGWVCICDCGVAAMQTASALTSGKAKSCGCLKRDNMPALTHGRAGTTEYRSWSSIKTRCFKTTDKQFRKYGARGITMCERWRDSFAAFFADMGPKPSPKHTVDRIDNDKGYEPSNCRWATGSEQCRNKRNNVVLEHYGKRQTLTDWSEETGLSLGCLQYRRRRGLSPATGLFNASRRAKQPCA